MDHRSPQTATWKPVVVGTGLVALDVVILDNVTSHPLLFAGGTCGNVLAALAYMGWDSYPIARLGNDAAAKCVVDDLEPWGVKLDFVSLSDSGSTPVVVEHTRQNRDGERAHSFSRKCPACGGWLPWYKPVKAASVPEICARLPKADVFYFDRTSRGAVSLAQNARKNGALVVFEPSSASDPALLGDALAASHIVKVASDRLSGNDALLNACGPLLLIETLGSEGLRYSLHQVAEPRAWEMLPAFRVAGIRDAAGAGDWCTAGIISSLGLLGAEKLAKASLEAFQTAMQQGQAMASWACQFKGARGGMYAGTKQSFDQAVRDILNGETQPAKDPSTLSGRKAAKRVWCNRCREVL